MSTPENRKVLEEGMLLSGEEGNVSFGWSSPWPVFETDIWLKNLEEDYATILYYARTSDPHVTVWAEYLGFEMSEDFETEDHFRVTSSEILFLDKNPEKVTVDVSEGRMKEEVVIALMFEDSEKNTDW